MWHCKPLSGCHAHELLCTCATGLAKSAQAAAPAAASVVYDGQQGTTQIAAGQRPSRANKLNHLLSDRGVVAAMQGKCTCKLANGRSCRHLLFTHDGSAYDTDIDGIKDVRAKLWKNMNDRERGRWIFGQLKGFYDWWDWDGQGHPTKGKSFQFRLNGKVVCRSVWLEMHGICPTGSQYNTMRQRVITGEQEAYDGDRIGDGNMLDNNLARQRQTCGWMSVCSWFCLYAHCNGDYMPDREKTILPHVSIVDLHAEYEADMKFYGRSGAATYQYFVRVWAEEPLLETFEISNLKYNFEHCCKCSEYATALSKAKTACERQRIKAIRNFHLGQCKKERLQYEIVVRKAEASLVTSICIDGWSVWTTTAPHFCRPIKGYQLKGGVQLRVTGAIVHGPPGVGQLQFYISDETVPHDTNLNVEVIRRVLVELGHRGQLQDTIHIQTDNAGDNKVHPHVCMHHAQTPKRIIDAILWQNKHMFAFLMKLVKEGVGKKVVLTMLIVGHTHIDIDQKFRWHACVGQL
jgi:hypothetical protein